ncbi:MAG: hypothetical protein WAZ18_04005 [Alphaproteobacteria bacterium]
MSYIVDGEVRELCGLDSHGMLTKAGMAKLQALLSKPAPEYMKLAKKPVPTTTLVQAVSDAEEDMGPAPEVPSIPLPPKPSRIVHNDTFMVKQRGRPPAAKSLATTTLPQPQHVPLPPLPKPITNGITEEQRSQIRDSYRSYLEVVSDSQLIEELLASIYKTSPTTVRAMCRDILPPFPVRHVTPPVVTKPQLKKPRQPRSTTALKPHSTKKLTPQNVIKTAKSEKISLTEAAEQLVRDYYNGLSKMTLSNAAKCRHTSRIFGETTQRIAEICGVTLEPESQEAPTQLPTNGADR